MLVRAKVSFAGKISMMRGKERDITDEEVLKDLLKAGYVELIQSAGQPDDGNIDEMPDGDKPDEGKADETPSGDKPDEGSADETPDGDIPDEGNADETPSGEPDKKPKRGKKK